MSPDTQPTPGDHLCCPTGPRAHDTGSRTEADAAGWHAAHAPDDEPEMTRWDDLR